jgi:peptide deformylase
MATIEAGMLEICNKHKGEGLSAPQAGILQRLYVDKEKIYINPVLIYRKGKPVLMTEGCLSLPGIYLNIPRFKTVTVTYQDVNGVNQRETLTGIAAQVAQHEIDHLDGIVFPDHRMPKSEVDSFVAKYRITPPVPV